MNSGVDRRHGIVRISHRWTPTCAPTMYGSRGTCAI